MENTQILLAPGAGTGLGKMLADALLGDPEFLPLMQKTAVECLKATAPMRWDKAANEGKGGWIRDPDFRVRAQMFFGLLAHMEGEPIKRIVHQHLGGSGDKISLLDALHDSPALAEALEKELTKAKFRTRNVKTVTKTEPEKPAE